MNKNKLKKLLRYYGYPRDKDTIEMEEMFDWIKEKYGLVFSVEPPYWGNNDVWEITVWKLRKDDIREGINIKCTSDKFSSCLDKVILELFVKNKQIIRDILDEIEN